MHFSSTSLSTCVAKIVDSATPLSPRFENWAERLPGLRRCGGRCWHLLENGLLPGGATCWTFPRHLLKTLFFQCSPFEIWCPPLFVICLFLWWFNTWVFVYLFNLRTWSVEMKHILVLSNFTFICPSTIFSVAVYSIKIPLRGWFLSTSLLNNNRPPPPNLSYICPVSILAYARGESCQEKLLFNKVCPKYLDTIFRPFMAWDIIFLK